MKESRGRKGGKERRKERLRQKGGIKRGKIQVLAIKRKKERREW